MGLTLETVVPWGRSFSEYIRMFGLTKADLHRTIVDVASGPASFNAEMTEQGYAVVSCDPIYEFSAEQIADRIAATRTLIMQGVEANLDSYVWQEIQTPADLETLRMAAMNRFLADFSAGKESERYRSFSLPALPFPDGQFDLALCSHFLFAYSDQLGWEFHQRAIEELCRIAREVRMFPLLKTSGERSPFVEPIQAELASMGFTVNVRSVAYEFQRGGNQLLQVCSNG